MLTMQTPKLRPPAHRREHRRSVATRLEGFMLARRIVLFTVASVLWGSTAVQAQTELSTIRGTATDPTGAVIAKGTITVVNSETNLQRTTVTNENGDYELPDLKRGTYRLTATSTGFKNFVADNIILE